MIGIIQGKCPYGFQATSACANQKCQNSALRCQQTSCQCEEIHIKCQQNLNFSTILSKIQQKKARNFKRIQELSLWYDQVVKQILSQKENMIQQVTKIINFPLDPIQRKLLSLIDQKLQSKILSHHIIEVNRSIDDDKYGKQFQKAIKEVTEYSKKAILKRLSKIPSQIIKGSVGECIHVKMTSGQTLDMDIDLSSQVSYLKKMIYFQSGQPAQSIRIIFAGIQLSDSNTLLNYNIQPGSTLHAVLRLYGQ